MLEISRRHETDVLIIGGGIAGLMAAISARDKGLERVTVIEKANIVRSGAGGSGNDHFRCYIPEVHGEGEAGLRKVMAEHLASHTGSGQDTVVARRFFERSFEVVRKWEEWGVRMRPSGEYVFAGHAFPGRPRIFLKYDGSNQKAVLSRETRKRGVTVFNDLSSTDILVRDGRVVGVLALDSSWEEPSFMLIRAKTVIMATGCGATRLYNNQPSPGWMFNTAYPGCNAGAMAQAWRIGARYVNMELPVRWAGPRYFARCGKGSWIGVLRYPDGRPIGPFVTKSNCEYGDITSDVWNTVFADVMRNGTGPAYIDTSDAGSEELEKQRKGFVSEGLTCILNYMKDNNLDFSRHAFEFMQYEAFVCGRGLEINAEGCTNIPGLYAAGDTVGNVRSGIGVAAVYGMIAGENAAEHVASGEFAAVSLEELEAHPMVNERLDLCGEMMARRHGVPWKEANLALQQLMSDYAPAGPYNMRSETLLRAGLKYVRDLRRTARSCLGADCSHTLGRALETLDLMDVGEALIIAARARTETRGMHIRADFTFTNPLWNDKFLNVWLNKDGRPVTALRERWLDPAMPQGRV